MPNKIREVVTTPDLEVALGERFTQPEWTILFDVADGTGHNQRRRADAIAMNMYPSRGLAVEGFEIKCSRGDWRRELKNPAKADSIYRYCDRWWVVATKGIVKPEELPPTWGLLELAEPGGKLRQKVAAAGLSPEPLERSFIAALLRSAGKVDQRFIDARVLHEVSRVREALSVQHARELEKERGKLQRLRGLIEQFEDETGVDLSSRAYGGIDPGMAAAINAVHNLGIAGTWGVVKQLRGSAKNLIDKIDEVLPSEVHGKAED